MTDELNDTWQSMIDELNDTWQSMRTAPDDGTMIEIIWYTFPRKVVTLAQWTRIGWTPNGPDARKTGPGDRALGWRPLE